MGGSVKGAVSAGTLGLYNPKSERTSSSSQTAKIDPALKPLQGKILSGAMSEANAPYYSFGQQLVGPTQAELQARYALGGKDRKALLQEYGLNKKGWNGFISNYQQKVSGEAKSGVADLGQGMLGAISAFDTAPQALAASIKRGDVRDVSAERFTDANINQYMNPFLSGVYDVAQNDLNRARQIEMAQTQGQAAMRGAYGGSRQAVLESENNRNYYDALARQAADLRARGFDAASGLIMQDANRALQASGMNQQADLGVAQQNAQMAQQTALANAQLEAQNRQARLGAQGLAQANAQDKLSFQYQDFLNKQNYPRSTLDFLTGIAKGVPQGNRISGTAVAAPNTAGNFFGNLEKFIGAASSAKTAGFF